MTNKQEGITLGVLVLYMFVILLVPVFCELPISYTESKADFILKSVGEHDVVAVPEGWINTITHRTTYMGINVYYILNGNEARVYFKEAELRELSRSTIPGYSWLGKWLMEDLEKKRRAR